MSNMKFCRFTENIEVSAMKFAFYTLGCKVNQYETQAMEQTLLALGHELGDFPAPWDMNWGIFPRLATVTSSIPAPLPPWRIKKTGR